MKSLTGKFQPSLFARVSLISRTAKPIIIATTAEITSNEIMYWFTLEITMINRMAVRGTPNASVITATSRHITNIPTGIPEMPGLTRVLIIVQINNVGKIGPPR